MGRVLVVGAGVVGLSCAVRLLEAGHRVDVVGRDLPLESTSVLAAALWYPYLAEPRELVLGWGARTLDAFRALAEDPATGVSVLPGTEVAAAVAPDPWWSGLVSDLARVEVPGWSSAWRFSAPVIDMPVYLRWLVDRVDRLGGTISRMTVASLPDPGHPVVNCTGLGARLLGGDLSVQPVRGQVLVVEQWGMNEWWLDSAEPTYVVPRAEEVVVGGTQEAGEWSRTPWAAAARRIVERAAALVPQVASARVLRQACGLRPVRPRVRVERVGGVVHCYGHGGAGVTLSWGCADQVVDLVAATG